MVSTTHGAGGGEVGGGAAVLLDVQDSFLAGGISGTAAAALTLPADVVKTQMQVELGQQQQQQVCKHLKDATVREGAVVRSTTQVVKDILRTHGVRGLFIGMVPRAAKVAPACAIMISSYEYCKDHFRQQNLNLE